MDRPRLVTLGDPARGRRSGPPRCLTPLAAAARALGARPDIYRVGDNLKSVPHAVSILRASHLPSLPATSQDPEEL